MKNIKIIAFIICFITLQIGVNAQTLTPTENKKGKWGYVNEKGKAVIKYKYDEAREFSEDLAAVKLKGLSGFIDKSGKIIIPLKYTEISDFSNGLAKVKGNYYWRFIDKTGRVLGPECLEIGEFSDGLIKVQKNGGRWGFVDKEGKEILNLNYEIPTDFKYGYAGVKYNKNAKKWRVIDKSGKEVLSSIYSEEEVLRMISEQGLVQKEIQRIQEEAQKVEQEKKQEKERKAREAQRKEAELEELIAKAETALDNDFYSANCPSVDVLRNLREQLEQLEKSIPNGLENMEKRTYLLQLQTGLSKAMRTQLLTQKYGAASARKIMAGKYEIGMSQAVTEEIMGVDKALYKQSITTVAGQKKEIWQFDYDNPALRGYSAAVINAARAKCPTLIFKSGKLTDILK